MKTTKVNQLENQPYSELPGVLNSVGRIDSDLILSESLTDSSRSLKVRTSKSGGAVFDATENYRYLLWRNIADDGGNVFSDQGILLVIMLNPNTADETRNDPTIRRCIGFAKSWGFHRLEVVNLFAVCAEKPPMLRKFQNPIGKHNDLIIQERLAQAGRVIVAWGNHGRLLGRDADVLSRLQPGIALECFGTTKSGMPRHPLYVRADIQPSRFNLPQVLNTSNIIAGGSKINESWRVR
jgi:hypothetical protein